MMLSLSTRWNAFRHTSGEAMLEEILQLGFSRVELGYDTILDLVPGIQAMVESKAVTVGSVHNFCPTPIGAPRPHPELYSLTSLDTQERSSAFKHISRTIEFAREMGASCIVVHAGRVEISNSTRELLQQCEQGRQFDDGYEKIRVKLMDQRERKARRHLDCLCEGIERLLPVLENAGITMAFENLPSWESIPTEMEFEELFQRFGSPRLAYWHDMGHGQVRQNLGFINHHRWLERLSPRLAGYHIHDVSPPAGDHLPPGKGKIDFKHFAGIIKRDALWVLEPFPGAPARDVVEGARMIMETWS